MPNLHNLGELRDLEVIVRPDGEPVHGDMGGAGIRTTIRNPIVVQATTADREDGQLSFSGHFYTVHMVSYSFEHFGFNFYIHFTGSAWSECKHWHPKSGKCANAYVESIRRHYSPT